MEWVNRVKKVIVAILTLTLGFSLSMGDVYAKSDGYGEVYTKRTFEEVNKDKGYKELEDYEYIYAGEEVIGIIYNKSEEFAISEGLAVTVDQGKEDYEDVVSKLEESESIKGEQTYFTKTRLTYAVNSIIGLVVMIVLGGVRLRVNYSKS